MNKLSKDIGRCVVCFGKLQTYYTHPNGYIFKRCLNCTEVYEIGVGDKDENKNS